MQYHASDQLNVEVTHIEHSATGLADYRESFHQKLFEHFLQRIVLILFKLLLAVNIRLFVACGLGRSCLGILGDSAQALLNALTEFDGLGAQLVIGKLLNLQLEGIDGLHLRHQRLDHALVLGAKNLA